MTNLSTDLLRQYVKVLISELRLSPYGRKKLGAIKGALGDLWRRKTKDNISSPTTTKAYVGDEVSNIRDELNKWFKQIQSISRKKISSNKVQEIKKFAAETYQKFLDIGENENVAMMKTIRAVDKKYASDV